MALAAFLEANPHPFLIGELGELTVQELGYDTIDPKDERPPEDDTASGIADIGRTQIYAVIARPETPFAHLVSVGRAANNDIVLSYEGVSKLHAVFTRHGERDWQVSDSDSQAGTTIDGTPIRPGEKQPVADGAVVAFGPARLTFLSAA